MGKTKFGTKIVFVFVILLGAGHIRIPEAEEMAEELSAYINSLGDIWR